MQVNHNQRQILITVGIPGSGKSHFGRNYNFANNKLTVIIERDIIREHLFNCTRTEYKYTKAREKQVTEMQKESIQSALSSNYNIVISDTNLRDGAVTDLLKFIDETAVKLGIRTNTKVELIDTPLATCMKRNLKRDHTVPESVLIRMEQQMRKQLGKYVHDDTNPDELPPCIIVDIDGTIADMRGKRGPFEWDKVGLDAPKDHIVRIVELLIEDFLYNNEPGCFETTLPEVIFMSGRDSICREETEGWLYQNIRPFVNGDEKLYMRPEGDNRPDTVIKEELFDNHIKGKYHVELIIDDRKCMVDHWCSMGFNVMDVGNRVSDF